MNTVYRILFVYLMCVRAQHDHTHAFIRTVSDVASSLRVLLERVYDIMTLRQGWWERSAFCVFASYFGCTST